MKCFILLNTVSKYIVSWLLFLKKIIEIEDGAKYSYKGISYENEPVLGKMLNNKSETAYKVYIDNKEFKYPSYVEEALKWIKG